jgi:hypothetical protein
VAYISGVLRGVGLVTLGSIGGDSEVRTRNAWLVDLGVDSNSEWPIFSIRAFLGRCCKVHHTVRVGGMLMLIGRRHLVYR